MRQGATKVRHNVEWNNFTTINRCYGKFEFARTAIRIMLQLSYLTMPNGLQKIHHLGSDVFRGDMVRQGATGATRCDIWCDIGTTLCRRKVGLRDTIYFIYNQSDNIMYIAMCVHSNSDGNWIML